MAKTFTEWMTKNHDNTDFSTGNDKIVVNQLEQFVDRIMGILHDIPKNDRDQLLDKFVKDLKASNEKI